MDHETKALLRRARAEEPGALDALFGLHRPRCKHEVSQGQWLRLTGENHSVYGVDGRWDTRWCYDGREATRASPVEMISWDDCRLILSRAGLGLPSEAQWEYAARGGVPHPWWTGSDAGSLQGAANIVDAARSPVRDPVCDAPVPSRVARGGGHRSYAHRARVSCRMQLDADSCDSQVGVRAFRAVEQ